MANNLTGSILFIEAFIQKLLFSCFSTLQEFLEELTLTKLTNSYNKEKRRILVWHKARRLHKINGRRFEVGLFIVFIRHTNQLIGYFKPNFDLFVNILLLVLVSFRLNFNVNILITICWHSNRLIMLSNILCLKF